MIAESQSNYFLKTERLGFRLWTPLDFEWALTLWGDLNVTRLIGGPFSEDEIGEKLTKEIVIMQTHGVQYWPVFMLRDADFVGCCGLRSYSPEKKIFELGFHLRQKYWRKGLAEEAARAVIEAARESLDAEALFAAHHPENLASGRVLSKLGFVYTHEELYAPTGRLHRCYLLKVSK